MKKEEMFDSLVANALDFLTRAISELTDQPKYSVIHFHAALELFLKARLMHEHWSLVVAKEPDWGKFVSGNFQSVSLDDAAARLSKVAQCPLSTSEINAFKTVSLHRNKMVHFFHEAHTDKETNELTQAIVKEQLKAWYFLHQLLTVQWNDVFLNWKEGIAKIDVALRKQHEFLQVVFDNLEPTIQKFKELGKDFNCCPSCGFEAQEHQDVMNQLYEAKCLVCGLIETCLKIKCTSCEEVVTFTNEGFATCLSCGESLEPEDVVKELFDDGAAYISAMNGGDGAEPGNCSDCDGYHTVIPTDNGDWLCANCFTVSNHIEHCGWCNEANNGDMEYSYVTGCNHCEGLSGWEKDD